MVGDYEAHLRLYARNGALKEAYIEPLTLRWTNSLDGDEPVVWSLDAGNEAAGRVEAFDIVEVMIRNVDLGIVSPTGGFVRDCVGIVRAIRLETDRDGITRLVYYAPKEESVLDWRSVMWRAGTANRSTFANTPAETLFKTVVTTNCTAAASVANGRLREGDLVAMGVVIEVEDDKGRGNALSSSFAYGKVLGAMRRLRPLAGGDFSLRWQGGTAGGGHTWRFAWHDGQLGADKRSGPGRVLFSLDNFSMTNPRREIAVAVATTAVVGGQASDEGERAFAVVDGPEWAADSDVEAFVDARDITTAGGLIGRGQARLNELGATDELTFDVLQTADTFYSPVDVVGRAAYRVGDLVAADYGGESWRLITRAQMEWRPPSRGGALTVAIDTEAYYE